MYYTRRLTAGRSKKSNGIDRIGITEIWLGGLLLDGMTGEKLDRKEL